MKIIIQYRRVLNDAVVADWRDWDDITPRGWFDSQEDALATIKHQYEGYGRAIQLHDVSLDQIGIYEIKGDKGFQFRLRTEGIDWRVGLKDALDGDKASL